MERQVCRISNSHQNPQTKQRKNEKGFKTGASLPHLVKEEQDDQEDQDWEQELEPGKEDDEEETEQEEQEQEQEVF